MKYVLDKVLYCILLRFLGLVSVRFKKGAKYKCWRNKYMKLMYFSSYFIEATDVLVSHWTGQKLLITGVV